MAVVKSGDDLANIVEQRLACSRCHARLQVIDGSDIRCEKSCGFRGTIADGIFSVDHHESSAFFDMHHEVMQHGSDKPGVRLLCYAQQAEFIERYLAGADVVVDIGCGPRLPYSRTGSYLLVGLDPSYESLKQNRDVDVPLHGHAGALPLPDQSVDAIVSLYAIHHFGGRNLRENRLRVEQGFDEFGRVLKPGGSLLIFELEPWWPAWKLQVTVWNLARRLFPGFDILFWREKLLAQIFEARVGKPASYRRTSFDAPMATTFAPVFALPGIRIPRFLFPFRINLYHWQR